MVRLQRGWRAIPYSSLFLSFGQLIGMESVVCFLLFLFLTTGHMTMVPTVVVCYVVCRSQRCVCLTCSTAASQWQLVLHC